MNTPFTQAAEDAKQQATSNEDPDPHQGGFTVTLLTHNDIPAFLLLQNTIRATLAEEHKHHLKQRTAEDLAAHMDAGMPIIGIKTVDGQLVGQALMSFPTNHAVKHVSGYPIPTGQENVTALVQSVGVHPAYRGKTYNLAKTLHESAADLAMEYGKHVLLAKVADTNPASGKSFLNNGFTQAASGKDPVKHYPVTYFTKSILPSAHVVRDAAPDTLALTA